MIVTYRQCSVGAYTVSTCTVENENHMRKAAMWVVNFLFIIYKKVQIKIFKMLKKKKVSKFSIEKRI